MADFDDSKPFTKAAAPEFDPSKPFTKQPLFGPGGKVPEWFNENPSAKELMRGTLEQAPMVGSIGGGVVGGGMGLIEGVPTGGTASLPLAYAQGVMGAGLGGGIGKGVENLGKGYLLGEEKSGFDQLTEPIMEIPVSAASQGMGDVVAEGAGALVKSKFGKGVGNLAAKAGDMLTGVPAKEIKVYAQNAKKIAEMGKNADGNIALAADEMRAKFSDDINNTRRLLNDEIAVTLKDSKKTVSSEKIVDALEKSKAGLDPDIPEHASSLKEIENLIALVKKKEIRTTNAYNVQSLGSGQITVQDANTLKQYLQNKAKDAYSMPGEIYNPTSGATRAAKAAAANAREVLNVAEPAIAQANNTHAQLHEIEDLMNGNLIAAGKPEAALLAAGSGANQRSGNVLRDLGKLTNTDMMGEAEKLAALRTFNNPAWLPVDATGKSKARMSIASGVGAAVGNQVAGPLGAGIGMAVAPFANSPATLKSLINAGLIAGDSVRGWTITPAGRQLLGRGVGKLAGTGGGLINQGLKGPGEQ